MVFVLSTLLFSRPGAELVGLGFPLHTVCSGPSYPQLDFSWALLPPAAWPAPPRSEGVTWTDELTM